jgi:hypothetical protein
MAALAGKCGVIPPTCSPVLALSRLKGYVRSRQMKRGVREPVPTQGWTAARRP